MLVLIRQCQPLSMDLANKKNVPLLAYFIRAKTRVSIIKSVARYAVILANKSSKPFFFPNMASLPPAILPERPALRPDCINMVAMRPSAHMI